MQADMEWHPNAYSTNRASETPTVSSVYSREDTPQALPSFQAHQSYGIPSYYETSSPERVTSSQATPTEEHGRVNQQDSTRGSGKKSYFSTHIPKLRRSASKINKSPESSSPNGQTRWDPHLGEPTRSGHGRPGQVNPGTWQQNLINQNNRYNVTISGGDTEKPRKASWTERAAKVGRDALALDTRPPWKGGAGRSAIVDPVRDTKVNPSPSQYTAVKHVTRSGLPDSDSDSSLSAPRINSPRDRSVSPLPPTTEVNEGVSPVHSHEYYPDGGGSDVSPISMHKDQRSYFTPKTSSVRQVQASNFSPQSVTRKPVAPSSVMEKENQPPPSSTASHMDESDSTGTRQPTSHFSWTTYADSNADAASVRPPRTSSKVPHDPELKSRFSWTTVNTATTYQQDSPPPSPPPVPVPPLDAKAWKLPRDQPPTPPPHTTPIPKSLPQPPSANKTMSHIDELVAEMDNLALQRRNIFKVIRELEKIDSASPMDVDWKTMKANKKRLEEYRARSDDFERMEHEVGRNLARARRKAEREEGIESGLWVRRVTD